MEDPATRPTRRRIGAVLLLTLALLASACAKEPTLAGVVRDPALQVGSVTLPTTDGEPSTFRAQPGGLLVVYFGYTFCPDICPTTMSDLSIAIHDLADGDAQRVDVAFATVDPERDTPEVLDRYLGYFFDDGIALRTEQPDELVAATDAFGVLFEVADHEPGDYYEVAHTAVTYVVNDTGTVLVEWPFGFDTELMTADLETLLAKESA